MITIEGIKVKARTIPEKKLVTVWSALTAKPFPRVKVFQLEDSDFDEILRRRKCRADERRELEEWGQVLSAKGTDACVFNADEAAECDYVILVRENPYHRLEEVLEHELSHIAREDL